MKKRILFYVSLILFIISFCFDAKAYSEVPYQKGWYVEAEDYKQKCVLNGTLSIALAGEDLYYDKYKSCLFEVEGDRKVKVTTSTITSDAEAVITRSDMYLYKLKWDDGDDYTDEGYYIEKLVKNVDVTSSTVTTNCMLDYGKYLLIVRNSAELYSDDTKFTVNFKLEDATIYAQNFTIPSQMTIYCDKEKDITATSISPSNYDVFEADWETSNEKVVDIFNYAGCGFETMCLVGNKAGKATVTATLPNGVKKSCVVTVKNGKPVINKKKMTLTRLDTAELWITGTSQKVKWSSSNKNIVTVSQKGKVKAKKAGKATITAKVGGKKLKCVVTVKAIPVNFLAYTVKYNTRNNTFYLKIENMSKAKIKVYSSGAYSQDKDFVKFDRNLYLADGKQYVEIKPGKKKTIKFKVKGDLTWPVLDDHTIYFKFNFEGKDYWAKVCGYSCKYSTNKKKWKYTEAYAR